MYHGQTPDTHANSQWIPAISICKSGGSSGTNSICWCAAGFAYFMPPITAHVCEYVCGHTHTGVCVGEDRVLFLFCFFMEVVLQ